MADITITVPNAQLDRAVEALCAVGGYQGRKDDKPARREFARAYMANQLRQTVLRYEQQMASVQMRTGAAVEPITVA